MRPISILLSSTNVKSRMAALGKSVIAVALMVCIPAGSPTRASAEPEFAVGGYYKHFALAVDRHIDNTGRPVSEPPLGLVTNRLRLNFSFYATDRIHLLGAYDLAPRIMDPLLAGTESVVFSSVGDRYRIIDSDERLYPFEEDSARSFSVRHNIDRLNATLQFPFADLTIGRQAVAWGSGKTVSPTDILVPFSITDLDVEERVGIDGLRLRIPVGALSELDLGYIAGEEFDWGKSAAFARGRFWVWSTDVIPAVIVFGDNVLLGIDLTRAFGGFGTWLEIAYTAINAIGRERNFGDDDYLRATGGTDYSVSEKLYGFVEYHYTGAGENDPEKYPLLFQDAAFTQGGVFLLGRHYGSIGASYQFTPLISGFGQLIYNASDNSLLAAPSVEYNIRSDVYLSLGAYVGVGEHARLTGRTFDPGSEFGGLYPDRYYGSFRFYF